MQPKDAVIPRRESYRFANTQWQDVGRCRQRGEDGVGVWFVWHQLALPMNKKKQLGITKRRNTWTRGCDLSRWTLILSPRYRHRVLLGRNSVFLLDAKDFVQIYGTTAEYRNTRFRYFSLCHRVPHTRKPPKTQKENCGRCAKPSYGSAGNSNL